MSENQRNTVACASSVALGPLTKLGIWLGMIAAGAAIVQTVAWLFGTRWSVLAQKEGGRGALLAIALLTLMLMMILDRRPANRCGFVIGRHWRQVFFGGFGLGLAFYASYCLVAALLGVYAFHRPPFGAGRWPLILLGAMSAFPAAMIQQAIFSGYLVGLLRDRYGMLFSTVVPALFFAVLSQSEDPRTLLSVTSWPLVEGMFLIALLLGLLRLQTGSILFPAGVLAGCIWTRRIIRKTACLLPVVDAPLRPWLAPEGDPRCAPVFWLLLAAAIAACVYRLWRRGEAGVAESQPVWDRDFRRVFPFSNTIMLAPLDVWLGRLVAARFRVGLAYVPRMAAILACSTLNTLLSLPERLVLRWWLRNKRVPDPVFILGVHRSGTTHLQNMLAQDPQFCTARTYQMMNPAGFCLSGWLLAPLFGLFLPRKRPMDGVRFHLFAPQEEEFIMAGTCRLSPYWGLSFPAQAHEYDRFMRPEEFSPRETRDWKAAYMALLRRLVLFSRRRPLLKNPYNTGRVQLLCELFPHARFIHIYRHPSTVYRSNMHLVHECHLLNQLQTPPDDEQQRARILANYRAMEDAFYRDTATLPASQVSEVRFEDLEADPLGEVERIYAELNLELTPEFQQRLERYLESLAGYQKNRFAPLALAEQQAVLYSMGPYLQRWGYDDDRGALRRAA